MRVLFRTDASSAIGTGHVLRCMSLAEVLLDRGHVSTFVCREASGHLLPLLGERGHRAVAIPADLDGPAEDAAATQAAAGSGYDWCIADHYHLDARFEARIRGAARRVLAIDDLADRLHDCDILVDASHSASDASVYDGLVPAGAMRLVGHDFVVLRKAFSGLARREDPGRPVRRLLVSFGGNDPPGMTLRALTILLRPAFRELSIDVTSSMVNPRLREIREAAERLPGAQLHVDSPRFHEILAQADLCLGAGGTTTWERFYLGVPAVVVTLAENQIALAARLAGQDLIRLLGHAADLSDDTIAAGLIHAIDDIAWRRQAATAGMRLVDGRGTARITCLMEQVSGICLDGGVRR